jgi:hypothetical protein
MYNFFLKGKRKTENFSFHKACGVLLYIKIRGKWEKKHPPDLEECLLLHVTNATGGSQYSTNCCQDGVYDNAQIVF